MKIGVALSGCDIGGVVSWSVVHWLRAEGIPVDYISACGTASSGVLLDSCSYSRTMCYHLTELFLQERSQVDLDSAIACLSNLLPSSILGDIDGLAISAMSVSDGRAYTFTNDYSYRTDTLYTEPLQDPYDILSASIGSVDGLGNYLYNGCKLCDYAVGQGAPLYPLHLASCDRVLSVSFLPAIPQNPYDILVSQRIQNSASEADLYIPILFPGYLEAPSNLSHYLDIAIQSMNNCKTRVMQTLCT